MGILNKKRCKAQSGVTEILYKNKYDWLTELNEKITKITNEKRVQNIYMCKNNEYKYFDIKN